MHEIFLQIDKSNFWVLNWYYLVAVFISATGLIIAYKNYRKGKVEKKPEQLIVSSSYNSPINTNNSPINIVNNVNSAEIKPIIFESSVASTEEKSKTLVKILFIDDNHTDYKMVSILKKAGWVNTRAVKDITDLDNFQLLESDIIFVDINGVGTTMF